MKIKSMKTALALSAILLFAAVGCKKQAETVAPATTDNSALFEAQSVAIVDNADETYNDAIALGGNETDAFYADNDGLPEAYVMVETDMDDAGFKRADNRYFACIKKLNLSDTQAMKLRRALRAYEACKAADIKAHREAYVKLSTRIENSRKELVAQLRNGKITKAQFEEGMAKLRKDFEISLRYIKVSFAKNLKACYYKFMSATKEILTERQWKAFVDCYR
ncbi:MAG: hypothetical protein PSX81_10145 [bacterium]|nr:hypothetical protein [bacterium]